jgi:hypothetical protein
MKRKSADSTAKVKKGITRNPQYPSRKRKTKLKINRNKKINNRTNEDGFRSQARNSEGDLANKKED